ncbi:MAG: GIY-YIG nuclease family protein [bacterium]
MIQDGFSDPLIAFPERQATGLKWVTRIETGTQILLKPGDKLVTHSVYILKCDDGSYYTGYSKRLSERIRAHKNGNGAKYTRGRGPFELVYRQTFETKSAAMSREYEIKELTRQQKEELISNSTLDGEEPE